MMREFNQQWEKDYVRKTAETLEAQGARRKIAAEKNAQRDNIDEAMGEGGGDEEEDGESEDDNEDACGGSSISKRDTHTLPTHSLTHPYIFTFLCVSHTNTLEG
jgi:hypothetical protein